MTRALFQSVLNSTRLPMCAAGWAKAQSQELFEKRGCNKKKRHMLWLSHDRCTGCIGHGFHMWFALLQLFLLRNQTVVIFFYVFPIHSLSGLHPV